MPKRSATVVKLEEILLKGERLQTGLVIIQERNGDRLRVLFSRWPHEKDWTADAVWDDDMPMINNKAGARNTPSRHILSGWVRDAVESYTKEPAGK